MSTHVWSGKCIHQTLLISPFRMTKELRESLVKVAKSSAEKCKVSVRKARQKAMADLKKKTDVSKDSIKRLEKHVRRLE